MNETAKNATSVQSVTRAFAILDLFCTTHEPLSVLDISRLLDLNRTTVHGLINTMLQAGYLKRSALPGRYTLSPKLYGQVCEYPYKLDVVRNSSNYLAALARTLGVTINLGILNGDYSVLLVGSFSPPDSEKSFIGHNFPLHATAMGKTILANIRPEVREEVIAHTELYPYTAKTITDREAFCAELETIRRCGYSCSRGEYIDGIACVAFPIWDSHGNICAAFSATHIPTDRFAGEDGFGKITELGLQYSRHCSAAMGWSGRMQIL